MPRSWERSISLYPAFLPLSHNSIAPWPCCTASGIRRASTPSQKFTKSDTGCAMAYWGVAISRRGNQLVGAPNLQVLKYVLEAAYNAKLAEAKTQRERDYISAIENYYKDWEKLDYRARVLAYEKAMEQVYLRYPEDSEAAVFYALAMNEAVAVLPADPNFTRQLKAGAILEKVLAANPEHPGALHYLIHSYDFPVLADRGLAAARVYGDVAPSAPHALHMPSHVYSMLGMCVAGLHQVQPSGPIRCQGLCSCVGFHGLRLSPTGARRRCETGSRAEHGVAKNSECSCRQSDWGRIGRLYRASGDSRALRD